ncbi:hypothetical protein O181_104788 [Austropuccinia psidii MF-1]|uniref:Uncharacterized protein n=1 Tax=Austropuccinia psidii MF-1 TaxID=1389203 RepID=A0A9Q3JKV7_9BASI|nr:hypothetical protein [Austropuccinia psidii MF-1]
MRPKGANWKFALASNSRYVKMAINHLSPLKAQSVASGGHQRQPHTNPGPPLSTPGESSPIHEPNPCRTVAKFIYVITYHYSPFYLIHSMVEIPRINSVIESKVTRPSTQF